MTQVQDGRQARAAGTGAAATGQAPPNPLEPLEELFRDLRASPGGLLPTITLALAVGVREMARRGALVKRLSAVETLGSTSVRPPRAGRAR